MNKTSFCTHCLYLLPSTPPSSCPVCGETGFLPLTEENYPAFPQKEPGAGGAPPFAPVRNSLSDGSAVLYSYDRLGRVHTRCYPWSGGGHRVSRCFYENEQPESKASRRIHDFILDENDTVFLLTEKYIHYEETPDVLSEKISLSLPGSTLSLYSSREWYGEHTSDICRGKIKHIRQFNGTCLAYEYLPAAGETHFLRITTLLSEEGIVPGLSTQTQETFDAEGNCLHQKKYAHDGKAFILIQEQVFSPEVKFQPGHEEEFLIPPGFAPVDFRQNLVEKKTIPSGASFIEQRHQDGFLLCEGGTGRQARFHSCKITQEGILTQIRLNTPDGPLKRESLVNGLGQVVLQREAAAPGGRRETSYAYNDKGQLVWEHAQGEPPRILDYDSLGNLSGLSILSQEGEKIRQETFVTQYCRDDFDPGDTGEEEMPPLMYRKVIRAYYNEQGLPITESRAEKVSRVDMQEGESQIVFLDKYSQYSVQDTARDSETGELTTYSYIPGSPRSVYEKRENGLLLERKNRSGHLFKYAYDSTSTGKIITITDRNGQTHSRCLFDHSGNVLSETDSSGASLTRTYDAATGLIVRERKSAGIARRFAHDYRARLISEETDDSDRILYEYDHADRITQIHVLPLQKQGEETANAGQRNKVTFRFDYDDASDVLTDYSGPGHSFRYQYDNTGRIHKIITSDRCWSEYTYSPSLPGKLERISFSDNTAPVRYTYNKGGLLTRVEDALGRHLFRYTKLMDTESVSESLNNTIFSLQRDILGRVSGYRLTCNKETILDLSLEYERNGKISKMTRAGERPFHLSYHPASEQLSGIAFPNGMRRQWMVASASHPRLFKFNLPQGESFVFESQPERPPAYSLPLLSEESGHSLPNTLSTPSGNWRVRYNARHLPSTFIRDSHRIEYGYDYRGRRVEKSVYEQEHLVERLRYTYAGELLLCEFDATDTGRPILLSSYLWDPVQQQPLGMTLWKNGKGTHYFYLLDTRRNIRGLVDEDCRIRAAYHYSDRGALLTQSGDLAEINPLREKSLVHEEELGISLALFYPKMIEHPDMSLHIPRIPTYFDLSRKSVPELWQASEPIDERTHF